MKKNLLLLLAFFALGTCLVKSQSTTPKYLSVLNSLSNNHLVPVANAQALSVGNTRFSWIFQNDGWGSSSITRLDSAARPVWAKVYDLSDTGTSHKSSVFSDICPSKDGNFALVGNTGVYQPAFANTQLFGTSFILKINTAGAVIWSAKLKATSSQQFVPLSIVACSDSGFAVCGKLLPNATNTVGSTFIARLGKTGNLLWMKSDTSSRPSVANSIVNVGDSTFYLIGQRSGTTNDIATIWKFNALGNLQWTKGYDLTYGFSIVNVGTGLMCLGGAADLQLFKIDYSGTYLFGNKYTANYNTGREENCKPKLKQASNNQFLISNSGGYPDAIITNSLGIAQWAVSKGSWGTPSDVAQLNNKDFIFSENYNYKIVTLGKDSLVWGQKAFIVTDSLGSGTARCYTKITVTETTTVGSATTIPAGFQNTGTLTAFQPSITTVSLTAYVGCLGYPTDIADESLTQLRLFPNPASHKISFASDNTSLNGSSFSLFNLDGKEIMHTELQTLENETSITIDGLPSGVYFYRLQCPQNETKVGKLIVAQGD